MVPVCPHTTVPHLGLRPQEKWGHWDLGLIRSWEEVARVSGAVAFHTATHWRARQLLCWIGMMRFIRCLDNTLRKARKK